MNGWFWAGISVAVFFAACGAALARMAANAPLMDEEPVPYRPASFDDLCSDEDMRWLESLQIGGRAVTTVATFEPGVYDIPEDAYHADPVPGGSLSYSGAKKLLAPGGPAIFAYEREHPRPPTKAMELGTAAHKLVLGAGQELAVIDAENWRGNKAKDAADEARAAGKLPLLTAEHEQVQAMAAAIRAHRTAAALFDAERGGKPEQSLFWCDWTFGIWRRARLDWMRDPGAGGVPVVADYKSCVSAAPADFARTAANFSYDMQADWYCEAYHAVYGEWPAFVWVAQEKTPPYLVATYQLDGGDLQAARTANERAMEIYRDCVEAGVWPGYSDEIELLELPVWARRARELAW